MADKPAAQADPRAHQVMTAGRLETFSDGVLAIIITVMVLDLKVPAGDDLTALRHAAGSSLLTYLLSFVYIGIYWNNHHHLFLLTSQITGSILWANLHLLFWLSLLPFTTAWMDETGLARTPMTVYGVNLLAAALAFVLLQAAIIHFQGKASPLRRAIGRDRKGKTSMLLYLAAISCSCISTSATRAATVACFVAVAILWLVPDRRIKRVLDQDDRPQAATLVARQHGPVASHPEHR